MFRTPARDVHVHVYPAESREAKEHLLLGDCLRSHTADRLRYEQVKRDLTGRWPDMNCYAEAKAPIIRGHQGSGAITRGLRLKDPYAR